MNLNQILNTTISSILLISAISVANAADTLQNKQLSALEKNRIAAEFKQNFHASNSGSFQKLNNNPWANKRAKQKQHTQKMLKLSGSIDSCHQFSMKQRNQCYAVGNNDSVCELYYNARLGHCAEYF